MKKILVIMFAAGLAWACGSEKDVTIKGEFAACNNQIVRLESVTTAGTAVIDSVKTDSKGVFSLEIDLPNGEPTFYNLRCENRLVPLIVAKGESVKVSSLPGLIDGYTVEGSTESALVREVKNILGFGIAKLDSLATLHSKTTAKNLQQTIAVEYTKEYQNIKRKQIEFVVKNSGSLAAIYALNQRLPGDVVLFGGDRDIVYFRMVAEAVEKTYPTSPYLSSLKATIEAYDSAIALNEKIDEAMQAPASFPEIELPDIYGKPQSLTQIQEGKVVLLDFWSVADESALFRHADYKELYNRYHNKGFEIYQVSVDTYRPDWVDTVQRQQLPWVSVCDFKGVSSPAVMLYGVVSVPCSYLLDREGNIVAINAYGDNLKKELKKLFR